MKKGKIEFTNNKMVSLIYTRSLKNTCDSYLYLKVLAKIINYFITRSQSLSSLSSNY